ncbi:RHS repeat-associated core domain-containing protein [Phytohabitans flavus]
MVTTTDGTQYWFGKSTQSTLTMPVAGNHTNEPCKGTAFKDSFCTQAYRWNLEYVVDVSGNTMSYTYVKEFNKYAKNNKTTEDPVSYDRSSYLERIDYGTRTDTTGVPFSVKFDVADRCLANCSDKKNWPDTPKDQECTAKPCNTTGPTFWSTKRLTTITAKVSDRPVESWTLHQSFPSPGDSTRAGLWLDRIAHKGLVGAEETVPDISFVGIQLNNRVDSDDHSPPMNWWRIEKIISESGGVTKLTYSDRDCVAGSRMPDKNALQNNTLRCYPVKWTPLGFVDPITDYFHKYVVNEVTEDDRTGGSTRTITKYEYLGAPAWHYTDEDGITKEKDKTWSGWRGYGAVRATKGDPGEQTSVETRFYRGMHGDKLPSGTRNVQLPAIAVGNIPAVNDEDQYAGMTRETITYNGPGGAEVSAEATEPWRSAATASRSTNGITVEARHTNIATVHKRTTLDGGRQPLTSSIATTYEGTYGLPTTVEDRGSPAAGDEQCTLTDYVHNTDNWVVGKESRSRKIATDCTKARGTGLAASDFIGDDRTFYDGKAFGAAPSRGLATRTEGLKSYNNGTPEYYRKTETVFDAHGRAVQATDLKGTTSTAYTPVKGGPVTQTIAKNILDWETTTTFEPAWNLPLSIVDFNSRRTDLAYDGLGRLTKVWMPGRDKSQNQSPSTTYAYKMRNDAATTVTTSKLGPNGGYITSWSLYDGLLRPRQSQKFDAAGSGKGVFTDAIYDSAGRKVRSNDEYLGAVAPNGDLYVHSASVIPGQTTTVYDGAGRTTAEVFKVDVPSGGSPGGIEKWRTRTVYGGDRTHTVPPSELGPTSMVAPPSSTAKTTIVDALGRTTELRQYHAGATIGSANPADYDATKYEYNRKDQMVKITDPAGNAWSYEYDLRGDQTASVDPDKGRTEITYSDAGEKLTTKDARGVVLAYTYDALGRKTSMRDDSATGPLRAQWEYDATFNGTSVKGQIVKSTRWTGGQAYSKENRTFTADYQASGVRYTVPTTEQGLGGTYDYVYTFHPDGSPKTMRLPLTADLKLETIEYEYDGLGRPIKEHSSYGTAPKTTLVESTEFTSFGETGKVVLRNNGGNSVDIVRQYEAATRRLVQIKTVKQTSPTLISDIAYTYDLAGNITKIADQASGDTQCFAVDELRRLTEAWTPGNGDCSPANRSEANLGGPAKYWHSYRYDKVGSRTQLVERPTTYGKRTTDYKTNAGNHTLASTTTTDNSGARTASYTYDETGNLRSRPTESAGKQTITWDNEGHEASSTDSAGTTSYIYDADGERLIRDDPAGKTLYLPGQELRYTKSGGAKTCTRYYTHGAMAVGTRNAAGLTWLTTDDHGTATALVNAVSQAVSAQRETPFGDTRGSAGAVPAGYERGFVGGTDDNTGLTHLGAREYESSTGRFISVDPVIDTADPQQMNGYAYGNNNPLSFTDPDGRFSIGGALKKAGNGIAKAASTAGNFVKDVAVSTVKSIKEDPLKFATGLVVGAVVTIAVASVCATGVGCLILAGAIAGAAAAGAEYGVDVAQGRRSSPPASSARKWPSAVRSAHSAPARASSAARSSARSRARSASRTTSPKRSARTRPRHRGNPTGWTATRCTASPRRRLC